ncbi:hypothetical protein Ocin01_07257 [Orchesella cincta]|uniref:Family 31 glucosidase KIAA1161 n=1 Tax=Orchesella cincta TaxID=48709 RepID=A0A1D2N302_ORCCI|nr:hypothetical protein Ocin01_07257 [Orchesella cincta]
MKTQTAPPINSSFDDLVEAGVADASPQVVQKNGGRRVGVQTHVPGRHPGGPPGVTISGFQTNSDTDDDPGSELSEPEFASTRVNLNPSPTGHSKSRNGKSGGKRVRTRTDTDEDDDDDDFSTQLRPLALRRKGSVAPTPIRIINSNYNQPSPPGEGGGGDGDYSEKGQASPTPSATSISSLLREKLGQVPIPGMFRNKKPKEYKLQAFVAVLFLSIILLVGSIYIIHKEKELQKSYFDRIRFSSKDRRIRVTNIQDRIVLTGVLGVNLNPRDKPWPCLPENQRENETCLEWMGKARLFLKTKAPPPKGISPGSISTHLEFSTDGINTMNGNGNNNNILCYGIYWEALNAQFPLQDCYDMGEQRGGYFYGGGEMERDQWPLNKTVVPYLPFVTGTKVETDGVFQWGRSLRRYYVNSEGAAIKITDKSPLFVSINHPEPKKICFGAAHDGFGFPEEIDEVNGFKLPFLNYTICTAENVLEISKRLADKDIWERLKHEDAQLTYSMATSPIWKIRPEVLDHGNQSDVALLNHTDKIAGIHSSEGFILLDETWQKYIGDLEADTDRFMNLAETFNITKRRGFRIALTTGPFFSTQSSNYVEGLERGVWITEKSRENSGHPSRHVPALTQYDKWNSVAVLDVTKSESRSWLYDKVKGLAEKYGIDALYADMGTTSDLPEYYQYSERVPSSDHAKDMLLQTIRSIPHLSTIGVSSAVKLPKPPTFVGLSPTESSWQGLQTVIPNILTLGLAGFPFLIPGSIGGDFFVQTKKNNNNNEATNDTTTTPSPPPSPPQVLPERELYIRWLQLAHFLPVVQYSFLPNDYDEEVINIATELQKDRKLKISKFLKKAMDEALTTGMPIIRPLWMIDPLDSNCLKISDEFAIGEDIIVAPILRSNSTERDIYLPRGIWKDEVERSSTKGERWLHNYKAKHNQIPYFIKLPDTGQILSRK